MCSRGTTLMHEKAETVGGRGCRIVHWVEVEHAAGIDTGFGVGAVAGTGIAGIVESRSM
jgi:hypothetical protein